jgi:hypothetical protein
MFGILKVFLFTALDLMTIHGAVVMDFLFIQPFGWIRIIIAWGRKIQNNPRDLNMVSSREVCGDIINRIPHHILRLHATPETIQSRKLTKTAHMNAGIHVCTVA